MDLLEAIKMYDLKYGQENKVLMFICQMKVYVKRSMKNTKSW